MCHVTLYIVLFSHFWQLYFNKRLLACFLLFNVFANTLEAAKHRIYASSPEDATPHHLPERHSVPSIVPQCYISRTTPRRQLSCFFHVIGKLYRLLSS